MSRAPARARAEKKDRELSIAPAVHGGARTMVHNFDACSKLWRDDPVRAALEKKQRAEASAQQRAESSAKMAALLQRKLNEKAGTDLGMGGPSGSEVDDEANYRRVRACPPRAQRTTSHHLTLAGGPGPRAAAEAATRWAQQRQRLVRELRVRSVREQVRTQSLRGPEASRARTSPRASLKCARHGR